MRTRPKPSASCSHAEFELLPVPVQRKYFSSLERLRIAEQHQLDEQLQLQHPTSRRSSRASIIAKHSRSLTLGSTRRRLRKAESLRQEHDITQTDAQFFLSLPDKVRKLQFSREEQILLLGKCDQDRPPPHIHLQELEKQRFDDFQFDFLDDDSTLPRGRPRRRSSSTSSVSPNRVSARKSEQEKDREIETSLTYLDTMSSRTSHQSVRPTSAFRRTLSLTNMPVRHSTSSAPVMMEGPLFGPQLWHQRANSQSGRRSSHTPTAPVFDAEATHYQDPEARKKLRMFLASAQKFDEAVEFGFPSTAGEPSIVPRYELPPITTDARNFSRDMQTFLRDDKVSFLEQDDDDKSDSDGESVTDVESPITPSSTGMSFRCHTRHLSPSVFSSMDSTGLPPIHPMAGRLNREMTLRMTLTRPDLRADEEQLYGWKGQKGAKDDPFALEELHLTDDMTGAKGAFAIKPKPQGNLVTRLFKRASKRGTR
ncbi:hypothetical protein K505DRAFT_141249 [Melanomma pulvis-pyrius CBS 109.77]|uniref:Mucin-like protein n=1 Tax=Melanomma pulvis-pyrius CBS 109.77 TaxID=1314802 RepID=A0A6A6WRV4_9PLEO|nr:hypothetical protein K505DRAFT_141249 [Melanomma pulvis-pyrius CBS 109.77]